MICWACNLVSQHRDSVRDATMNVHHRLVLCLALVLAASLARLFAPAAAAPIEIEALAYGVALIAEQSPANRAAQIGPQQATPTRTPTPISLGNFVWNDYDGDGIQDPSEPGIGGVRVELWNAAKSQRIDTDTTSAGGFYTVVAPIPGTYRIRVILPAGSSFTLKGQGSNITDSDINPSGTHFGYT